MNVLVLFEARRGGKGFAAVGAGMGSRANVLGTDVPLEVAWVGKHLKEKTPSGSGNEAGGRRPGPLLVQRELARAAAHGPSALFPQSCLRSPRLAPYLDTVFTFKPLPAVVRHLVTNQVGFPVEGLRALVALVLPLLGVDHHVLLQAAKEKGGKGPGAR